MRTTHVWSVRVSFKCFDEKGKPYRWRTNQHYHVAADILTKANDIALKQTTDFEGAKIQDIRVDQITHLGVLVIE